MSTEDISVFFAVKEEICSDDDDDYATKESSLNHNLQASINSSIKNNIQVQVLSYLDIENIKEEPNSENEDLCYDQELSQTLNSESTNYLDQIVKIKEEDEYEFRIVELNTLNDDYVDNNKLDSIVEFEEEQKTSFRVEDHNNYEASIDATQSQRITLNQFSTKPRFKPSNKADGNPKLAQKILNRAQNRSKNEGSNLVLHTSNQYVKEVSKEYLDSDQELSNSAIKQEVNNDDSLLDKSAKSIIYSSPNTSITPSSIENSTVQKVFIDSSKLIKLLFVLIIIFL